MAAGSRSPSPGTPDYPETGSRRTDQPVRSCSVNHQVRPDGRVPEVLQGDHPLPRPRRHRPAHGVDGDDPSAEKRFVSGHRKARADPRPRAEEVAAGLGAFHRHPFGLLSSERAVELSMADTARLLRLRRTAGHRARDAGRPGRNDGGRPRPRWCRHRTCIIGAQASPALVQRRAQRRRPGLFREAHSHHGTVRNNSLVFRTDAR